MIDDILPNAPEDLRTAYANESAQSGDGQLVEGELTPIQRTVLQLVVYKKMLLWDIAEVMSTSTRKI